MCRCILCFRLHGESWSALTLWYSAFFPVIVSCLLLVPVYAIGRRWLGGRRSAAVACLYLALAPAMIWHGQYLRTNALLLLVAACSLWSFMHAAERGGRGWWGLNWALNAVMLLLHIVGSLMLLAQGLYLLLTGRWRTMFAWGSANAVLLLPWFLMSTVGRLETLGHVPPLSHLKFLAMMLGGNFLTLQIDPERQSFGEYHAWVYEGVRFGYAVGSDVLRALVMVGVLCAGVWAARRYRGRFNPYLLVGLVAFVPVLFLRGVSLTWISVEQTSHSIVSFVGLALLLGAGVTTLQRRSLRAVVVLAIFVPLSVYAVLVVQADTRSDNIAVAELIREHSVDGPIPVVVVDCCWVNDIILPLLLAANLGVDPDQIGDTVYLPPDDAPFQLRVAHTLQAVIDVIEGRTGLAPLPDTFVIVASDGSVLGRQDLFERYLKKLGVLSEQHVFSDYRVWVCQRDQSSTAHHTKRYFSRFDYRGYLERAGFVAESDADWRRAKRALRRGVGGWAFESYSHEHYMMMLLFVAESHPRLAAVLSRDAIARYGASSNFLLALGLSLVAGGNMEEARGPLEEFVRMNDRNDLRYLDMVRALLAGDWQGYRSAYEVFVDRRFICPRILRRIGDIPERGPIRPEDFDCVDCPPRESPRQRLLPHTIEENVEEASGLSLLLAE